MNETTTMPAARDDALDALTLLLRRAETAGDERRLMQRDVLTQVHLLGIEGAAAYYFPEACGDAETEPFDRGKNGELLRTIRNFRLLLETLAPFQTLRKNVFSGRIEWNGSPLCDEDESRMLDFLETHYALKSERDLEHAVRLVAAKRAYHPVRERLASLPWDGKAHILPFLIHYMGAAPTAYSGECARLIFHCGVARIMEPGFPDVLRRDPVSQIRAGLPETGQTLLGDRCGLTVDESDLAVSLGPDVADQPFHSLYVVRED